MDVGWILPSELYLGAALESRGATLELVLQTARAALLLHSLTNTVNFISLTTPSLQSQRPWATGLWPLAPEQRPCKQVQRAHT